MEVTAGATMMMVIERVEQSKDWEGTAAVGHHLSSTPTMTPSTNFSLQVMEFVFGKPRARRGEGGNNKAD